MLAILGTYTLLGFVAIEKGAGSMFVLAVYVHTCLCVFVEVEGQP